MSETDTFNRNWEGLMVRTIHEIKVVQKVAKYYDMDQHSVRPNRNWKSIPAVSAHSRIFNIIYPNRVNQCNARDHLYKQERSDWVEAEPWFTPDQDQPWKITEGTTSYTFFSTNEQRRVRHHITCSSSNRKSHDKTTHWSVNRRFRSLYPSCPFYGQHRTLSSRTHHLK